MSHTTGNPPRVFDPLDEPPPYTARADEFQGETTIEFGPSRPFQQAQQPQSQQFQQPRPRAAQLTPQPTGNSGRRRGLLQQLSDSIDEIATQIERNTTGTRSRQRSAPNTSQPRHLPPLRAASPLPPSSQNAPPPLPARRQSSLSDPGDSEPSDFARDFYAAGAGDASLLQQAGTQNSENQSQRPMDGPTTSPVPGRPLLHQGQLLVYPKGHHCDKCYNTGYKHYDPLRPCTKCWLKYGKPFSGPLAYSYSSSSSSSNTQNINLQKPLPRHVSGPTRRLTPALPPRPGQTSAPMGGYNNRGSSTTLVSGYGGPPPGAAVYAPGDARIGGNLCWSCNGKGSVSILIDKIRCPVCGGCGRTFSHYSY
ncbi:hypothetical protein AGABI2DRAFT_193062 [Agaricus bisporus var. bisporus H97]|uniref:hypothetical protein n=1 Tax=Agaricus bisporus var. bisporus (strain H97 / ATCC MYA-4626 / FGSC 10389) TaxID=936046 RepID=UPI00029F61EB|nr:hypothetical protein AGABI2DRAFT_193062 [Agaricus bisporus var. bisporus H97]EKV46320.1 hypothetical protein AGABI2DRAFT_193062 [Agaricus bisporus var. bisporus H97]